METQRESLSSDLQQRMLKLLLLNIVDLNIWEEHLQLKKQNQENKEEVNKVVLHQVKAQHVSLETWASMLQKILFIQSLKIVEKLKKSELLKIKMAKYHFIINISLVDSDMLNSLIMPQLKRDSQRQDQMLKEELLELILLTQHKEVVETEEVVEASEEEAETEEVSVAEEDSAEEEETEVDPEEEVASEEEAASEVET